MTEPKNIACWCPKACPVHDKPIANYEDEGIRQIAHDIAYSFHFSSGESSRNEEAQRAHIEKAIVKALSDISARKDASNKESARKNLILVDEITDLQSRIEEKDKALRQIEGSTGEHVTIKIARKALDLTPEGMVSCISQASYTEAWEKINKLEADLKLAVEGLEMVKERCTNKNYSDFKARVESGIMAVKALNDHAAKYPPVKPSIEGAS